MIIGLDLDKTLLTSVLPYEFVDANEKMIDYKCNYGHLLYNEKRKINKVLVSGVEKVFQTINDHQGINKLIILTGSWKENIPPTYYNFLSKLFPTIDVTLVSNPCRYISEESIALFKADEIIKRNIQVYIDDDQSISNKIKTILNYNDIDVERFGWIINYDCRLYMICLKTDENYKIINTITGLEYNKI